MERYRCWILVVTALAVYHNALFGPFVLDDVRLIADNPRLASWRTAVAETSRPLVQWTFALNYALGGHNVVGYHLTNVLLHAATAVALYALIRRAVPAAAEAGFVAVWLWVVHPLPTAAVNYVVQRGELLVSLLMVLTLWCVARQWRVAAVGCCGLAMLAKPTAVALPVLVWLYDRSFVTHGWRSAVRARPWFYAGLAATWLLLPLALWQAPTDWVGSAGVRLGVSWWEYARTQPGVILHYLRLVVWPVGLCFDPLWPVARPAAAVLPALVLAGVVGLTLLALARWPALGFAAAAFFLLLAPTSSVVPIQDLAFEHRMYLPLAAVLVVVVMMVGQGMSTAAARWAVTATALLVWGALTIERNFVYQSAVDLWSDTVVKAPHNYRAWNNLGNALEEAGAPALAIGAYRRAIQLAPHYALPHQNLGVVLQKYGYYARAAEHHAAAVARSPHWPEPWYYWGIALLRQGDGAGAAAKLAEVLRRQPDFPKARAALLEAQRLAGGCPAAVPGGLDLSGLADKRRMG